MVGTAIRSREKQILTDTRHNYSYSLLRLAGHSVNAMTKLPVDNPTRALSLFVSLLLFLTGHAYAFGIVRKNAHKRIAFALSMSQNDPFVIPQERYDDLIEWALSDSPSNVAIKPSNSGFGYGLYSTAPAADNSILFEVPHVKCITLQEAWKHPYLGKHLKIMSDEGGPEEGSISALSAFLSSEVLREQSADWEEDETLQSRYRPYLRCLPSGRGVSGQDHVLWWTNEEVESMFQGSVAYNTVHAMRDWVDEQGEVTISLLVNDLASRNSGLSVALVSNVMTTAFVNVLTRSLRDDEVNGQKLVPVLDMAQHGMTPNIKHETTATGSVVVRAARDLQAGEELTMMYTELDEETLTDPEFFVAFGFVSNTNRNADGKAMLWTRSKVFFPVEDNPMPPPLG